VCCARVGVVLENHFLLHSKVRRRLLGNQQLVLELLGMLCLLLARLFHSNEPLLLVTVAAVSPR
jgi:hypothetical protein